MFFKSSRRIFRYFFILSFLTLLLFNQKKFFGKGVVLTQDRGLTREEIKNIVDGINTLRWLAATSRLQSAKSATDMLLLHYSEYVAKCAQKLADHCNGGETGFTEDNMGQVFFSSNKPINISELIEKWKNQASLQTWEDLMDFTEGQLDLVQAIWSTTREVGCGYNRCPRGNTSVYRFVCDYFPGFNPDAPIFVNGIPCTQCPVHYICVNNGLCRAPNYTMLPPTIAPNITKTKHKHRSNSSVICASLYFLLLVASVFGQFFVLLHY